MIAYFILFIFHLNDQMKDVIDLVQSLMASSNTLAVAIMALHAIFLPIQTMAKPSTLNCTLVFCRQQWMTLSALAILSLVTQIILKLQEELLPPDNSNAAALPESCNEVSRSIAPSCIL
jgi:hypothetical protein